MTDAACPRRARHRRGRAGPRARRAGTRARPTSSTAVSRRASAGPAPGEPCRGHAIDASALAAASVAGGNPVIPLVGAAERRGRAPRREDAPRSDEPGHPRLGAHARRRARGARGRRRRSRETEAALRAFARAHRDQVAAARTLTQHAVPTTVGLRAANWLRGVRRARRAAGCRGARRCPRSSAAPAERSPSFVELVRGAMPRRELPAAFAAELGLAAPDAPWHTTRWPVTELGDALVQAIDAVGVHRRGRRDPRPHRDRRARRRRAAADRRRCRRSRTRRHPCSSAPPRCARRSSARRCTSPRRSPSTSAPTAPGTRSGRRCASCCGSRSARPAPPRALVAGPAASTPTPSRATSRCTGGLIVAERLSLVLGAADRQGARRRDRRRPPAGARTSPALLARRSPSSADVDVDALLDPADYTGLAGVARRPTPSRRSES